MKGSGNQIRRLTRSVSRPLPQPAWLQRPLALARRALEEFRADYCTQLAAAISFHLLFSLFPLAITAVAVVGLLTHDAQAHAATVNAVLRAVPLNDAGTKQLRKVLNSTSDSASALGILGLLGVLWSASGVMSAVRTALNIAWDTDAKRPFMRGKLVDLALIAGSALVTSATLALTVAAGIARQGATHLPEALRFLTPLAGVAVSVGVIIASTALLFAIFALLYRLVPAVPTRFRDIWPGALVAAAGFEALQYGFSVYLGHFSHYDKVYGSLGAIVTFLLFVYLASMVFLFGSEIASEYPRLRSAEASKALHTE